MSKNSISSISAKAILEAVAASRPGSDITVWYYAVEAVKAIQARLLGE